MASDGPFERVLTAARAGEGWALAELFRDLHPRIRRYLNSLAPSVADDIASDTWLDVVRSLDRFRGDASNLRALAFSYARTHLGEVRDSMSVEGHDVIAAIDAARVVDVAPPAPPADAHPVLATLDTDAALER